MPKPTEADIGIRMAAVDMAEFVGTHYASRANPDGSEDWKFIARDDKAYLAVSMEDLTNIIEAAMRSAVDAMTMAVAVSQLAAEDKKKRKGA